MTKRRRRKFREIEVIETLLLQGVVILCFRCKKPITLEDVRVGNVNKEHLHELELDGPDIPDNCRYSHKGKPCHHFVTYGNGATTAGSSANRIAKANNPKRKSNFIVSKPPIGDARELIYSRPGDGKPKHKRKMQSHGFDKSRTRHFDGTVTARKQSRRLETQGDIDGR